MIAIDAKTGRPIWKTEVANTTDGYSITHAPLVVKDKVIVGVGGGEYGIRGFIAAYDAATGKEAWRFYTIPGARRARVRDVAALPAKAANALLRSRRVEARRRIDLDDRLRTIRSST